MEKHTFKYDERITNKYLMCVQIITYQLIYMRFSSNSNLALIPQIKKMCCMEAQLNE